MFLLYIPFSYQYSVLEMYALLEIINYYYYNWHHYINMITAFPNTIFNIYFNQPSYFSFIC